jgi:serine palmitoyltransferase
MGQTLGKYYVLLLVATKDISLVGTGTVGTYSSDGTTGGVSSSCISTGGDSMNNDTVCTIHDATTPQPVLLLHQLPKQLYTMIITFPGWYSEWWWNLVQKDPIHVLVETILLLSIFYFLVSRRGKTYKDRQSAVDRLTKQEEDELIAQWIRHERQPLTPYTTSNNSATGTNNHRQGPMNNGTATTWNNEYRHTLVIHKSSGRFMQVEEVLHPSSHLGSSTGNSTIATPQPNGVVVATGNEGGDVHRSVTPTTSHKTTTVMTQPGTSAVHFMNDLSSLPQSTPVPSDIAGTASTAIPTDVTSTSPSSLLTTPTNIIQVLNFATMDFLGMSADYVPTALDDDDDNNNDNDIATDKGDGNENVVPVPSTTLKASKRLTNQGSGSTTTVIPTKPTTTKVTKERPLHPVKVASLEALDRYGCGSCGPRGFYGTIDVHLHIEKSMATFLHTEDAILYSDGASTVTSTVAAFCKRGDIIIVDEAVYEPIRTGVQLSRATVKWFAHNNMNDLRRVLTSIQQSDKKRGRKSNAQRRFIVVEGLYKNTGSICPLDELIALKHEFSCRLILDESFSFGTLGPTGRGVTELYQQKIMHDVEITCVSLENAMGSIGGLTTGTEEIVDHQRLSGSGYCYSASSPPFTASAALAALNLLQSRPDITLQRLNRNRIYFQEQLQLLLHDKLEDLLIVTSDVRSPIIFLQVADIPETEYLDEVVFLQEVVRESFIRGVAFVATATGTSAVVPALAANTAGGSNVMHPDPTTTVGFLVDLPSSIRMTVSAVHTLADIDCAIRVLGEAVDVVMSRFYDEETTM